MTRTIPSAKQMEDSRKTHYFRDDEGERLIVITEMLPNGEYGAWVDGQDDTEPHGIGYSMMEAISDLRDRIADRCDHDWIQNRQDEDYFICVRCGKGK